MSSNKRVLSIITAVLFVSVALMWLALGIRGLSLSKSSPLNGTSKRGELAEFTAAGAKEVYDVRHRFMGIPIGTERYYYLIAGDVKGAPMLVKASEKWFKENFNERGLAKNGSVTVKGEVRELKASNRSKVAQFNSSVAGKTSTVSTSLYVNARYRTGSVMRMAAAVTVLAYGAAIVLMLRVDSLAQMINNKVGATVFGIVGLGLLWLLFTMKVVN